MLGNRLPRTEVGCLEAILEDTCDVLRRSSLPCPGHCHPCKATAGVERDGLPCPPFELGRGSPVSGLPSRSIQKRDQRRGLRERGLDLQRLLERFEAELEVFHLVQVVVAVLEILSAPQRELGLGALRTLG